PTSIFIPRHPSSLFLPFFFTDSATTELYTLSLHDALPICRPVRVPRQDPAEEKSRGGGRARRAAGRRALRRVRRARRDRDAGLRDRKSTRLNSSHSQISYAVFCLKKKKKKKKNNKNNRKIQ